MSILGVYTTHFGGQLLIILYMYTLRKYLWFVRLQAIHALYMIGSVEDFVLSMVEYDAPGRVIFTLSQHMV